MHKRLAGRFVTRWLPGLLLAGACVGTARASACTDLEQLNVPKLEIRSATDVAAGRFAPGGDKASPVEVPAFCRVVAVVHPVPTSNVLFELWMPASKSWNSRLESFGSENYIGGLLFGQMAEAVRQGYAATSLEVGLGQQTAGAVKDPDALADWAYRGVHSTAQAAKRIVAGYYGHGVEHAFFNGCGVGGGTQALSEAERFPQDYDGILAGDAQPDRVRLNAALLWDFVASHDANGAPLLTDEALKTLHGAALAACDAKDGLKDGVIGEPTACRFDPKAALCKGGATTGCLTQPQVEAARKLYAGPKEPGSKGKDVLVSGYPPGSELGWKTAITEPKEPVTADFFRLLVEGRPSWDWHSFDLGREVSLGEEKMEIMNASETDLNNFRQRGGRLIVYHGWADGTVPAGEAIEFFNAMVHDNIAENPAAADFARLFLSPGLGYCGAMDGGDGFALQGGERFGRTTGPAPAGPRDAAHDLMSALDQWVSKNIVPETVIARRSTAVEDQSRLLPLCAYPMTPRWNGKGDRNDVDSYSCLPMK